MVFQGQKIKTTFKPKGICLIIFILTKSQKSESSKLEKTQMFNSKMGKYMLVYSCNRIVNSYQKQNGLNNKDETNRYNVL